MVKKPIQSRLLGGSRASSCQRRVFACMSQLGKGYSMVELSLRKYAGVADLLLRIVI